MHILIAGLIICILLLCNLVAVVIAQPPEDSYNGKSEATDGYKTTTEEYKAGPTLEENPTVTAEIKPTVSELINPEDVVIQFNERRMTDNKIIAADAFLVENGFSAITEAKNTFGLREVYKGIDENGVEQEAVFTLKAQDYEMKGSKGAAALAEVEIQSGGEKQTYSFVLLAPEGDINTVEEYKVVESEGSANVERAHSFWSCVRNRIRSEGCGGSSCVDALTSCWHGSIVGYLGCLAWRCGICYGAAAACCVCDSGWACSWLLGHCDIDYEEPAPTPAPSCSVENNINRYGSDIRGIEIASAGACCQACLAESRCRAYTYVKPGVQADHAMCWLKSSVPPTNPDTNCISGVKR